ncbi:MAG: serine/threonine protein kinase [Planctomycetes bacterium]|nr:serine/threonine protein kinase [Planctomycetota bacterium]
MQTQTEALSADAIPGYRITGVLGVGGYATVFSAIERAATHPVALKVIAKRFQGNRRIERAMAREIDLLCELRHDGIVRGFGVVSDYERLTLVMELVGGGNLASRLAEGDGMSPDAAAGVLFHVGLALSYLHERGVLHLDIKPGNIMVTPEGRTKLIDFSLARPYGTIQRLVPGWLRRPIPGTPAYMAPEQIRGERVDPRSDLYALGIVGYRALTNRLPFEGDSMPEVLHRQESCRPAPPSKLRQGIPLPLETLILRLLEKDPADRPGSADEVCAALAPQVRRSLQPGAAAP